MLEVISLLMALWPVFVLAAPSKDIILALVGFLAMTAVGIASRLLWSGFRDTIVRAVLDSSLKQLLGGLTESLQTIKSDLTYVKSGQDDIRGVTRQASIELNAVRSRFDGHQELAQDRFEAYQVFKHQVEDFMEWARQLITEHKHVTAPSVTAPPNGENQPREPI